MRLSCCEATLLNSDYHLELFMDISSIEKCPRKKEIVEQKTCILGSLHFIFYKGLRIVQNKVIKVFFEMQKRVVILQEHHKRTRVA